MRYRETFPVLSPWMNGGTGVEANDDMTMTLGLRPQPRNKWRRVILKRSMVSAWRDPSRSSAPRKRCFAPSNAKVFKGVFLSRFPPGRFAGVLVLYA
jgi:hypothetical protein